MLPKLPRLTADQAERMLLQAGFKHTRTKGSHRIYQKGPERKEELMFSLREAVKDILELRG